MVVAFLLRIRRLGFESLRARNIIRDVTCGTRVTFLLRIRPLWTSGASRVLACAAECQAMIDSGVHLGLSRRRSRSVGRPTA